MLTDANNLPPSGSLCDGIGEEFGNNLAEVAVLHEPTSWDLKPPGTRGDYVLIGLVVDTLAEDAMP